MKTIKKTGKKVEVRRVSNEEARELVNQGYKYVPKSVWKKINRKSKKVLDNQEVT